MVRARPVMFSIYTLYWKRTRLSREPWDDPITAGFETAFT